METDYEPASLRPACSNILVPHKSTHFAPGDTVVGRFQVIRLLGRGDMGDVYEALDLVCQGRVALKVARLRPPVDREGIERFKREVTLARQVTHASVCRIFEFFHHQGVIEDVWCFSMELLAGETLAARIYRQGRLTPAEALPIISQVVAGLAAAHCVKVVHCDLTTQHVMLTPANNTESDVRAVITDFGKAHFTSQEEHVSSLQWCTADFLATPAYVSPEQLEGGAITPAVDVYALGVLIYEMVCGSLPFEGSARPAAAVRRLKGLPVSPRKLAPDLSRRWESTIMRCLERRPEDRFPSVLDLLSGLN